MIADSLYNLKEKILKEKKIVTELKRFFESIKTAKNADEIAKITSQIDSLKESLKKTNEQIPETLKSLAIGAPLKKTSPIALGHPTPHTKKPIIPIKNVKLKSMSEKEKKTAEGFKEIEYETLRRIKKGEKVVKEKKEDEASLYIQISNKIFSGVSLGLTKKPIFRHMKRDLIKANLQFPLISYISVTLFTTLLSFFLGIFMLIFFLFFNLGVIAPFITMIDEEILARLLKVFWIPVALPILTFVGMYVYPSLEKKSAANRIDEELPFAAIHMSAISGSMVDPSKIFEIIVSTKEYPKIGREFTKLVNEIHIYGYDLVNALKNTAANSPSKKLSDLLNGLATTITSGGDLPRFFDERANTLLFDYRMQKEKEIRSSETFMDIYISLVIAAPMILMLLLMMMKISGLGIQLSTNMITLIMVLGVSTINVFFLMFLILKQPAGGVR